MHELMEGPAGVAQALARLLVRWLQRHNLFATTLAYVGPTSETIVLEAAFLFSILKGEIQMFQSSQDASPCTANFGKE